MRTVIFCLGLAVAYGAMRYGISLIPLGESLTLEETTQKAVIFGFGALTFAMLKGSR